MADIGMDQLMLPAPELSVSMSCLQAPLGHQRGRERGRQLCGGPGPNHTPPSASYDLFFVWLSSLISSFVAFLFDFEC